HFSQAATDNGGTQVFAQIKAVINAGGNRNHIFERGTDLNADNVVVEVQAHIVAGKQRVYLFNGIAFFGGQHSGSGQALGKVVGKGGAAENGEMLQLRYQFKPNIR